MIEYVIGHVSDKELEILEKGTILAAQATEDILKNGVEITMNKYNKKGDF